ncbi:MAG TPA: His/Gly/Thr/Pro-type tRNA ligase C-terminal domain-containing protein [Gaiellaceae bacterium]|nr:His/Gly/Thr/Pro-type tRNA ligase C-terminal domain-containing protein [Gaiellaceae bacterium]
MRGEVERAAVRDALELRPPDGIAVLDVARRARVVGELRRVMVAEHDDGGQIGRRYRRQDEIGTPWALTIDEQTLADDTVTIRDRDSLAQERISIGRAREYLLDRLAEPWRPPQGAA